MSKRDYYEVLGVHNNASDAEIKKAYRKLAMEHHPDKNQGEKDSEEKFKEVCEAYGVLKDPQKRAYYDQFGHAGPNQSGFGGADNFGGGFNAHFGDIFGDVFSDFFGAASGQRSGRTRGHDLRYNLEISFEEAAFGVDTKIKIPKMVVCKTCSGSGARPGTSPETCVMCAGTGQVRTQHGGFFFINRTCTRCNGEGKRIVHPCTTCAGSGKVRKVSTITVNVPPGVDTGTRLRLTGEGEPGVHGGGSGDLYIIINVKEHPLFVRDNNNIFCEVPISFVLASLGGEIEVPTLTKKETLTIPHGTQNGDRFKLKGSGFPSLQGYGKGDEYIVIKVETPTKLNSRQKELLLEFAKISDENTAPMNKTFFEKVKKMFG